MVIPGQPVRGFFCVNFFLWTCIKCGVTYQVINYHLTYFSAVDVLYGILHVTIISCCSRSKTSTKWRWCIVLHWCPQAYFSAVFFQFFELCKVFWWRILFCLSGENQMLMNESNRTSSQFEISSHFLDDNVIKNLEFL